MKQKVIFHQDKAAIFFDLLEFVLEKILRPAEYNLLGKTRLSHIWHMTLEKNDKPFIITDGALNVLPKLETKLHILKNSVDFANRIGIQKPKVSKL